jgi:hypothetical protein
MAARDRPHIAGQGAQSVGPILFAPAWLDLRCEPVGDALEQRAAIGEVAVQRHRLDAKFAAEPAHRQRLCALAVKQRQRGADDRVARELRRAPAPAARGGGRGAAGGAGGGGLVHLAALADTVASDA